MVDKSGPLCFKSANCIENNVVETPEHIAIHEQASHEGKLLDQTFIRFMNAVEGLDLLDIPPQERLDTIKNARARLLEALDLINKAAFKHNKSLDVLAYAGGRSPFPGPLSTPELAKAFHTNVQPTMVIGMSV